MYLDEKLQLKVGAGVLIAVCVAVAGTLLFGDVQLSPMIKVELHFGHMAGLQEKADVHLAGQVIGQVTAVRLVPPEATKEGDPLHPAGGVIANVRLERRWSKRAAVNGEYFVAAKGLLGKPYIEIGPPADNAKRLRPLTHGDRVRGIDPPILDRALYNAIRNLEISRQFLRTLTPETKRLAEELRALGDLLDQVLPERNAWDQLIADAEDSMTELVSITDGTGDLGKLDGVLVRARRTVDRASTEIAKLRSAIDEVFVDLERASDSVPPDLMARFRRVKNELDSNFQKFERALASGQDLLATIQRAEGTIGALIHDPEFSDDARNLGKILKRQPWKVFGHPGNKRPTFGKTPTAPEF